MADVTGINPDEYTPLEMAHKIPWANIQHAILVYEDENGDARLHVTSMDWKVRAWLCYELLNYNAAVGAAAMLGGDGG